MMSETVDTLLPQFRNKFSEFVDISDDKVKHNLELALSIYALHHLGILYLAAHFLVVQNNTDQELGTNSNALGISSIRVDSKSVSFNNMASSEADNMFTSTNYGLLFLEIRRANPAFAAGVSEC